jgi:hypothetical protein
MKRIFASVLCIALASVAGAQVVPAATQGTMTVSAGSEAVAFHYNGAWSVGNHTTESFDVLDWGAQKGNSFSAEVNEFFAPAPGFSSYLVGGKYTPDISGLVSKTNLSGDQFRVFLQGAGGVTNLPSGATATAMGGGGATYMFTPNLTWSTLDAYALYFNGKWTTALSSGIYYTFNAQQANSFAVQRMIRRAAAKQAAARSVR